MSEECPYIQNEISEMMEIQERVTELQNRLMEVDDFDTLIEYNHCLYALVVKQQVIYTRMKYSSDPKLLENKAAIEAITLMSGREPNEPMDTFFMELKEEICDLLENITGERLEDFPFDSTL
tara:strand:+ start:835 stop:1200 length:366 start_codon:yes stop_codon:yes gene_type:complete